MSTVTSATWFAAALSQTTIPELVVDVYAPGGAGTIAQTLTLKDARVVTLSSHATGRAGTPPIDQVALLYTRIEEKSGGPAFCWDVIQGKAC